MASSLRIGLASQGRRPTPSRTRAGQSRSGKGFAWPAWAADRQRPAVPVSEGDPLCTVLARSESPEAARALAMERIETILAMAEGA